MIKMKVLMNLIIFFVILIQSQRINVKYTHQSFSKDANIIISWVTLEFPSDYQPICIYGTTSGSYRFQNNAISTRKWRTYGYVHDVEIKSYQDGVKTYYYRCGSLKHGTSEEFTFLRFDQTKEKEILIYGDTGTDGGILKTNEIMTRFVHSKNSQMILNLGDIAYADRNGGGEPFERYWRLFMEQIEPMASRIPYLTVVGNHEYYFSNFTTYNEIFRMPNLDTVKSNMWWSIDYQNIHIVSINTETDYPNQPFQLNFGDQLTWLKNDLKKANANRSKVPWIVVLGHRPLYSSAFEYSNNGIPGNQSRHIQNAFEDIFYNEKVDLVFVGHVHSYERTFPIYKNQAIQRDYNNPRAPVYVVVGNAGCQWGLVPEHEFGPYPSWLATRNLDQNAYGFGILKIREKQLIWEMRLSSNGQLNDTFTIQK